MFEVVIEERAEKEFYNAIEFYKNLNISGLSERFYQDYLRTIELLELNPYFKKSSSVYRVIKFNKFPFLAFYKIYELEKVVKIVSFFHTSQDPQKYPV
jgi:plasmid stabilization system protein ParE